MKKIFKTGAGIALLMFLTLVFSPGLSYAKDLPEVDGVYNVPGHKNLKVRVFVHKLPAKPNKPQPTAPQLVCSLNDNESNSVIGPTGWKLPANWSYSLNSNSAPSAIRASVATIVENSFSSWSAPLNGKVSITRMADTTATRYSYDGVNLITWGRASNGTLGVTYTWYNPSTGEAVETDTIMNNKYSWYWSNSNVCAYSGNYDAQNIMTHELGHWYGLNDHYTADYTENTMYGYGSKMETKKNTLTLGDIAGLAAIYGF